VSETVIWRGYHSKNIFELVRHTWNNDRLLILHPPTVSTIDYLSALPNYPISFEGDWGSTPSTNGTATSSPNFPDKPVLGLFSTGSTARKLVLYSKENVETSLKHILSLFDSTQINRIFCYPQPFHTFGLTLGYVHSILTGRDLIFNDGPYNKLSHHQWIENPEYRTLTLGTPTHFKDLIAFQQEKKITPGNTYSAIIGGAEVSRRLWIDCREKLAINFPSIGYGATEAAPGLAHLPPGVEPKEDGEIGIPLPHVNLRIISDRGISFSGPSLCLAYIQKNQITFPSSLLIENTIEQRKDGIMIYKGRHDLVLNRGGEKFSLEEIERKLSLNLGVNAICLSFPDARLGEELGIVVSTPHPNNSQIFDYLSNAFGRLFNSQYLFFIDQIPLNSSFKIDRLTLRKTLLATLLNHAIPTT